LAQKKLFDYNEGRIQNMDIIEIEIGSPSYPFLLKQIKDPPRVLYARGDISLLNKPAVAIVGTRKPSKEGELYARKVAKFYSDQGFVIVSGLAFGIDAIAIDTALESGGMVIGVVPSISKIIPKKNEELAKEILNNRGLLLAESESEKVKKYQFVRRNRIISGLSLGVIVIETDIRGGTMHTVNFAKEQGRLIIVADLDAPGNKRLKRDGFPVIKL